MTDTIDPNATADNIENSVNSENTTENQPTLDPLVKILASLKFNDQFFEEIALAHSSPEKYAKLFETPDVLILWNLMIIIQDYDPSKDIEGFSKANHDAYYNLVKWMLLKFVTDPQLFSYIGHMVRYFAIHLHPSSYFPIRYSEKFVPNHFFTALDNPTVDQVNSTIKKDPSEVFKWKEHSE